MTSSSGFPLSSTGTEKLSHVHLYFHLTNVEHQLGVEQVAEGPRSCGIHSRKGGNR